ncbi:response regulator transcription factor [Thermoactinomyces mirandus]|uniref:Response regulator transcription factor n=1 Tax=Thermoactinomyces mirandus TaxID=2756294 RepID=A0A7W1XU13_9BACL|nr:response regulator transcription factor [Thermoactinomyces mirandus]
MGKILIIDDEEDLVALLKDSLERKGHTVLTAYDGAKGAELARQQPELIILDIMMPGMDGYEVCRKIRDIVLCPIIFLSAKQSEADKIKGLALGGDDYVAKPFGLKELLARVEAHLRREKRAIFLNDAGKRVLLHFKNLTIDLKSRRIYIHNEEIMFTKREFEIIELLSLHPGQVFSKEQIYEKIWGYDAEGDCSTVTEHVKNIRAKLAEFDHDTEYISTVWGIGYRFNRIIQ